jgi:hypothetical protein
MSEPDEFDPELHSIDEGSDLDLDLEFGPDAAPDNLAPIDYNESLLELR